ncbi:solute carrier family 25 member 46 [Eurytemora carolleeae]|uniref:solute carrier family 25 member 46 n=1 Tax=Eurytemora carolleeae TaxID=1294199 RepID=UPI000C78E7DF|nr:solute carrier family 25 member 46 [Eurytemora carolleeae]|eukprot:XP_023330136.1 solute carrier family 25 member 46-like [Eurytemora affinis]
MAGMEGLMGGRGEPNYRVKTDALYIDGDPRRPAVGGKRGKVGYQQEVSENSSGESDRYAGFGIGITGLIAENLICHPFIILRRQCQVNVDSGRYHTTPFTLLPVIVNLNRWQGTSALFKGVGSSLTIKGLNLGIEDCVSKFTPWPKEINKHSSLNMIGQHLLLKCVSTAIITPFYSASLVETVQSDIASEKPGVLDVFREGIVRLISWSDPRCGRMLPVWVLIPPQVIHNVLHYIIKTIMERVWLQVMKASHKEFQRLKGAVSRDPDQNLPGITQYQNQAAGLAGQLVADVILFPLETVLHRLHLQGTRSIIDNLDSGKEVIPILTRYEGVGDCFSTILREEGVRGLFKGFGALILQYSVHFLIIKFSSKIISQIVQVFPTSTLGLTEAKPPLRDHELASLPKDSGLRDLSSPGLRDLSTPGLRDLSTPGLRDLSTPGLRDLSTPGLRDLSTPGLRDLSTPLSRGIPGLPSLREDIPDQEVYSSRTSLADYSGSSSPRRNIDSLDYTGTSRKSWRSMENL